MFSGDAWPRGSSRRPFPVSRCGRLGAVSSTQPSQGHCGEELPVTAQVPVPQLLRASGVAGGRVAGEGVAPADPSPPCASQSCTPVLTPSVTGASSGSGVFRGAGGSGGVLLGQSGPSSVTGGLTGTWSDATPSQGRCSFKGWTSTVLNGGLTRAAPHQDDALRL